MQDLELWQSGYIEFIQLDKNGYFAEDTTTSALKYASGVEAKRIWEWVFVTQFPGPKIVKDGRRYYFDHLYRAILATSVSDDGPSTVFFYSADSDSDTAGEVWERLNG